MRLLFVIPLLTLLILPSVIASMGCCVNPMQTACVAMDSAECCPETGYGNSPSAPVSREDCLANYFWESEDLAACVLMPEPFASHCRLGCCCIGISSGDKSKVEFAPSTKPLCEGRGGIWTENIEDCSPEVCSSLVAKPEKPHDTTTTIDYPTTTVPETPTTTFNNEPEMPVVKQTTCRGVGGVCRRGLFRGGILALLSLIPWCEEGEKVNPSLAGCEALQRCCISAPLNFTQQEDSNGVYEIVYIKEHLEKGSKVLRYNAEYKGDLLFTLRASNDWWPFKRAFASVSLNGRLIKRLESGDYTWRFPLEAGDEVTVELQGYSCLGGALCKGSSEVELGIGQHKISGLGVDMHLVYKPDRPTVRVLVGEGSDKPISHCIVSFENGRRVLVSGAPYGVIHDLSHPLISLGEATFEYNCSDIEGRTASVKRTISVTGSRNGGKCGDGTPVNFCSNVHPPQFCYPDGRLENACHVCGCPTGLLCAEDRTCRPSTCITILKGRDGGEQLDLAFIGHNYPPDGMEQFRRDVEKSLDTLFSYEPFKSHKSQVNVHIVEYSGSLNCKAEERGNSGLITCDFWKLNTLLKDCPLSGHDQMIVFVNDNLWGGSASMVEGIGYLSASTVEPKIFVHEFGHSFGLLADEYTYGIELTEFQRANFINRANCDSSPSCSKWEDLIGERGVGCFKGCTDSNWYRPILTSSVMLDLNGDFNPVGERQLRRMLEVYR